MISIDDFIAGKGVQPQGAPLQPPVAPRPKLKPAAQPKTAPRHVPVDLVEDVPARVSPPVLANPPIGGPSPLTPPEYSDDALALDFVQCAANLRWSHGLGWMLDDGVTWSRDDNLRRYDVARRVCRIAAAGVAVDAEARRLASARTVNATLSLAQADPGMVVPTSVWDADTMALNMPAGIVDLRTGKLRTRGIEFVTQAARVAPDFAGLVPYVASLPPASVRRRC